MTTNDKIIDEPNVLAGFSAQDLINSPNVQKAKAFAFEAHFGQIHADLPMEAHLNEVVSHLAGHLAYTPDYCGRSGEWQRSLLQAGYLHDVVEDTHVNIYTIYAEFGTHVGNLVRLLTDVEGRTRFERHLHTYNRLRNSQQFYYDALLVKLCDRWHNHARSTNLNQKWAVEYRNEYPYFKTALWEPGVHPYLWMELDAQYKILQGLNKNNLENIASANDNVVPFSNK